MKGILNWENFWEIQNWLQQKNNILITNKNNFWSNVQIVLNYEIYRITFTFHGFGLFLLLLLFLPEPRIFQHP